MSIHIVDDLPLTDAEWLREMRVLEHEGDVEFDALWNAAGSRVQPLIDELREVA